MANGYLGISRRSFLTGFTGGVASALVAAEPEIRRGLYGVFQKLYDFVANPRGSIDKLVKNPQDGLENRLDGSAHAQEPNAGNALPKTNAAVDYDGLATWAKSLDSAKDYPKIIDRLKPHENSPDNRSAAFYNILAIAYENNKEFFDAERNYLKAIELKPDDGTIRSSLAHLYLKDLGRREEALAQLQYVVDKIDRNHKFANFLLKKVKDGNL